jgi:hypothetical protein
MWQDTLDTLSLPLPDRHRLFALLKVVKLFFSCPAGIVKAKGDCSSVANFHTAPYY